jgi:hypothetical protein
MKRLVLGCGYATGAAFLAVIGLCGPSVASGAAGSTTPLFSISKTENRNYVQFAERLDDSCAPAGSAPVYAFWRMMERGPGAVEPLLPMEQGAYGIASQTVLARDPGHSLVRVTLRALPSSPLFVEARRAPSGACEAWARTSIGGVAARLSNVHAVLRWPFGVARLLVSGWAVDDGHPVRETRSP